MEPDVFVIVGDVAIEVRNDHADRTDVAQIVTEVVRVAANVKRIVTDVVLDGNDVPFGVPGSR